MAGEGTYQPELTDLFERQVADDFDDELSRELDHQDGPPVRARARAGASSGQGDRVACFAEVGVGALRPRVRPHRGPLKVLSPSQTFLGEKQLLMLSMPPFRGSRLGFKGCVGISFVHCFLR